MRILLFSSVTFKTSTNFFIFRFFAYYFLKVHLHHFSKIKSHEEVTKQLESMLFLLFLLDNRRIRIHISDYDGSGSGNPPKHMDPTDPDIRNTGSG